MIAWKLALRSVLISRARGLHTSAQVRITPTMVNAWLPMIHLPISLIDVAVIATPPRQFLPMGAPR